MNKILKVKNISKSFGGLKAISNLTFDIEKESITAIIGPNGAGKTTLFNLISGLIKPDRGKIFLDDTEISLLKPFEIPHYGIARTFQNLSVFSNMSVIDNIMLGQDMHLNAPLISNIFRTKKYMAEEKRCMEKAVEWLEFTGIANLSNKKINEIPFEKQRLVEITRALASEPKLILLDEPAAGLNITETMSLVKLINRIRDRGITVLIVEHDMDMVMEVSDRIVVLNFGEKIAEGKPEEIQKNEDVIRIYLGTTF